MTGVSHYLLVLHLAEERDSPPISSGHVADAVDRSPAATTEMLQRLESDGYLTYEPAVGLSLSAAFARRSRVTIAMCDPLCATEISETVS